MATCTDIAFYEALQVWFSGAKLDGYCVGPFLGVFGPYSSIALGRVAKLLAFMSSVPLLFDLLGEDRVHRVASEIGNWTASKRRRLRSLMRRGKSSVYDPHEMNGRVPEIAFVLSGMVMIIAISILGEKSDDPHIQLAIEFIKTVLWWLMLLLIIVWLLLLFPLVLTFLLRGVVAILKHRVLCWYVRAFSISLLLLAFTMDLLFSS